MNTAPVCHIDITKNGAKIFVTTQLKIFKIPEHAVNRCNTSDF